MASGAWPIGLRGVVRRALVPAGRVRRIPVGLAEGLRLEIDPGAPAHVYVGLAETELARHVRSFAYAGARCYDIGGHNAYYAMILARLSERRVVSFEYDPAYVALMRRNLAHNPSLADLVDVREAYLAHENRPAVNAWRLDDLIAHAGLSSPDVLKIDVEGAEATVLSGAPRVLESRPHLIIETHGRAVEDQTAEILLSHGYRPRVLTQRRRLRERRAPDNRWLVAAGDRPRR